MNHHTVLFGENDMYILKIASFETSPGPLIPDWAWAGDSSDKGQASSLQTFQTASKLLTWLASNQDFTITLENLNIFTDQKN